MDFLIGLIGFAVAAFIIYWLYIKKKVKLLVALIWGIVGGLVSAGVVAFIYAVVTGIDGDAVVKFILNKIFGFTGLKF